MAKCKGVRKVRLGPSLAVRVGVGSRGNIVLAALFVSIFLFFLSVALVWSNRQDIALNLFMEHKLKAQSAARSGAMTVYAQLRETGRAAIFEKKLPSGASWRVELESVPPEGYRGQKLLVRSRGTSGLQHAYFTLHLEALEMGEPLSGDIGRVFLFPEASGGGGVDAPPETGSGTPGEETTGISVILGGGALQKVRDGDQAPPIQVGNGGPIFGVSEKASETAPFYVLDWLPVFPPDGSDVMASGPTVVVGPPQNAETVFSVLKVEGQSFLWEDLPEPLELEQKLPNLERVEVRNLIELSGTNPFWTGISLRGIAETAEAWGYREPRPRARTVDEVQELVGVGSAELASPVSWGEGSPSGAVRYYLTVGGFAAVDQSLFSFGYEYLYRGYDGSKPTQLDALVGARMSRWPCILAYDLSRDRWRKVWGGLDSGGDVRSEILPDLRTLLAGGPSGPFYSVSREEPRRLLTLSGDGEVKVGGEVPPGVLCSYRGKPFLLSTAPEGPGLVSLVDGETIGFETLPQRLPEISGEVAYSEIGEDGMVEGLGQEQGAPISAERTVRKTAHPGYRFRYAIAPRSRAAVDGEDLWVQLVVMMERIPPTYETVGEAPYSERGSFSTLGRYDGARWTLLPHGLRALLESHSDRGADNRSDLKPPEGVAKLSVGRYSGLPAESARYSVISVDTRPFRSRMEAL